MRSDETKASLTCALSPGFVVRFDASSATSISVERNEDASSTSAIVPRCDCELGQRSRPRLRLRGCRRGAVGGCDGRRHAGAASNSGWASSSVPSASRFRSTLGASMDSDAICASRPNTRMRSSTTAIAFGCRPASEPSRRLIARPSTWASPRSSSLRSEGVPVDEHDLEPRGQRAAGKIEPRLHRQVRDVGRQRKRVEIDVERRFAALGEGRGRSVQARTANR